MAGTSGSGDLDVGEPFHPSKKNFIPQEKDDLARPNGSKISLPFIMMLHKRLFSALRHLKNILGLTIMTQIHLNNLLVLYVHQYKLDKLNLQDIGDELTAAREHRHAIF